MKALALAVALAAGLLAPTSARATALQLTSSDTALLFGGSDAEGGIGDWYISNGVVQAIIDNVGPAPDLVGVVPPGTEPPIQSEIAPTGGTIIDLARVGANNDQLPQMFTVAGLSTSNFLLYDTISIPNSFTIRATGKALLPPLSALPAPCADVVTDYTADSSGGAFVEVTSTITNNCGAPLSVGFLDVFIWTIRGIIPFSGGGGAALTGGKGFDHPALDLSNPATSLELPTFMGAPGQVEPADGIMDPANSTISGEVSYGLLGVRTENDADGPGGAPATVANTNNLFGVSSTLASALGHGFGLTLPIGGTFTYVRRIYVSTQNDVRSVADTMITELSGRGLFMTGTISGNVDAADTPIVEASILVRRIGRCAVSPSTPCKVAGDCPSGACTDPVPTPGQMVGGAMDHIRTDAAGAFSGVVLPRGHYEVTVSAHERDDVLVRPVIVGAGDTPVTIPPLSARGTVAFSVREKSPGLPAIPARLVFKGVSPTVDPRFHYDLKATLGGDDVLPETFGGTQEAASGDAAGQANIVYTASGSGSIAIKPGTYDVYAARGMEYNVQLKRITVASGGTANADFRLKRVIKTKNALSADFHVHSGRSLDASAPLRDRVKSFASEGVEVIVSTDHDKNLDYTPIISSLGLGNRITSIVGDELTGSVPNPPGFPQSYGHINAWPLTVTAGDRRDGAIQDEYVAPNWIYKRLRDAGAEVIQYNHPRAGVSGLTTIGIFNNIGCNRCANDIDMTCTQDTDCPAVPAPQDCTCVGYQPDRLITMPPNDIMLDDGIFGPGSTANPDGINNLDFDVMEIMNAVKDGDFKSLRQVRRDWLSLLNQGIVKPGTAVSDSHRLTVEHPGWGRTFVLGVGDDPAALNVNVFNSQVKAGRMLMSGGPYIELTAKTNAGIVGMGDTLASSDGVVRLKIRVRSPAWMPVEEVRIVQNGFVVSSFDATTHPRVRPVPTNFQKTGKTSRFRANLTFTVSQDAYFIVEAGAKLPSDINTLPTPPPIVDIVEPDVVPEAITNPIFIDRNGNSTFDPPGLPVMMASRIGSPAVETAGWWEGVRHALGRLVGRFTSTAVAQKAPGEMTGVTQEQKAAAAKKGEYFPLYEFAIPRDAAEAAERAAQQAAAAAKAEANSTEK